MIAGISKPQWLLISANGAVVLVINAIGMWDKFLLYERDNRRLMRSIQEKLGYTWSECGNPWTSIIPETVITLIVLLTISWLIVYTSRKSYFQELPLAIKFASELLIAIFVGSIFMVISLILSSIWVYNFLCGLAVGLHQSDFVIYWSIQIVFPATSLLNFWAMFLSNPRIKGAVVALK